MRDWPGGRVKIEVLGPRTPAPPFFARTLRARATRSGKLEPSSPAHDEGKEYGWKENLFSATEEPKHGAEFERESLSKDVLHVLPPSGVAQFGGACARPMEVLNDTRI